MRKQRPPHAWHPLSHEEYWNTVVHGIGCAVSLFGAGVLCALACVYKEWDEIIGVVVFSVAMVVLYAASTFYHGAVNRRNKGRLRLFDHSAIYLLIAGTYTPFLLGPLKGTLGWILFALVWSAAAAGIMLKLRFGADRFGKISVALYLIMGWLIMMDIQSLMLNLTPLSFSFLLFGGIAYSAGVWFYMREGAFAHLVWHFFVLFGTVLHFLSVLFGCVLPS